MRLSTFASGTILLLLCKWQAAAQAESLDIEQIAQRDLYTVLELQPNARELDIKAAYRNLARKWHPDKNPNNTQAAQSKFAEIAEAYEVLSNDNTRVLYDRARRLRAAHSLDGHAGAFTTNEDDTAWGRDGLSGGSSGSGGWYFMEEDSEGFGNVFEGFAAGRAFFDDGFAPFGGAAFEFHARDPMELFEAMFGGSGWDNPEADYLFEQQYRQQHEEEELAQRQEQQQQQQQQRQQKQYYNQFSAFSEPHLYDAYQQQYQHHHRPEVEEEEGWAGQDFEHYQDFEEDGRVYRRVITTVDFGDGTTRSTVQDYQLFPSFNLWSPFGDPVEYYEPSSRWRRGNDNRDGPIDHVLRLDEYLRVGHSIASVDGRTEARLDEQCNLVVTRLARYNRHAGDAGSPGTKVWESGSFSPQGHCYAMLQDNGVFVVMSGDNPTAPGNVLWASNKAWYASGRMDYHAVLLDNGNLMVSTGVSPLDLASTRCVWGAFGCPGEGGSQEWRLLWLALRTKAGDTWIKITRSARRRGGSNHGGNANQTGKAGTRMPRETPAGERTRTGPSPKPGRHDIDDLGKAVKHAAQGGWEKVKEAWTKVKEAAGETAEATSRPRHW